MVMGNFRHTNSCSIALHASPPDRLHARHRLLLAFFLLPTTCRLLLLVAFLGRWGETIVSLSILTCRWFGLAVGCRLLCRHSPCIVRRCRLGRQVRRAMGGNNREYRLGLSRTLVRVCIPLVLRGRRGRHQRRLVTSRLRLRFTRTLTRTRARRQLIELKVALGGPGKQPARAAPGTGQTNFGPLVAVRARTKAPTTPAGQSPNLGPLL
ncbi:hypothetical protein EV363DRAFT_1517766, partial [Boletus edulis]